MRRVLLPGKRWLPEIGLLIASLALILVRGGVFHSDRSNWWKDDASELFLERLEWDSRRMPKWIAVQSTADVRTRAPGWPPSSAPRVEFDFGFCWATVL